MNPGRLRSATICSLRSTTALEADITTFIDAHNENPRPYRWVKSADQILASVKRFCHKTMSRTSDSGDEVFSPRV
ncbi:hypothetical protein CFR73_14530 [Novacetimonas maltaceti]|nr:hypothetical protein CFR73_14530 [Novacetimonas maltaceti]